MSKTSIIGRNWATLGKLAQRTTLYKVMRKHLYEYAKSKKRTDRCDICWHYGNKFIKHMRTEVAKCRSGVERELPGYFSAFDAVYSNQDVTSDCWHEVLANLEAYMRSHCDVHAEASGGLKGAVVEFPFVSVGATENILMAATLAKGTTVLKNAAREPEIVDLAQCLKKMGAQIDGEGTPEITVQGVDRLHGATYPVVPDRIELGTYMLAPAIAGGSVECIGGRMSLVAAFAEKLAATGIDIEETARGIRVSRKNGRVRAVDVETAPFPGFPTDLQAQMMALMCTAEGTSVLEERIFENRFMHAPELMRMGADIDVHGGTAKVTGVNRLKGAPVMATDLRASVSLILAGLAAEGETRVSRVYHLDRGYEHVVGKLSGVGANIQRVPGE